MSYARITAVFLCLFLIIACTPPSDTLAQKNPESKDPESNKTELPSAGKLVGKLIEALGGEMQLSTVARFRCKSTMNAKVNDQTMPGDGTSYKFDYDDGKLVYELSTSGIKLRGGFDGHKTWLDTPDTDTVIQTSETPSHIVNVQFVHQFLAWQDHIDNFKVLELTKLNDRPAYKISYNERGASPSELYLDKESGLLIAHAYHTNGGKYLARYEFNRSSEWIAIDKLNVSIEFENGQQSHLEYRYRDFEYDVQFDEGHFDKPDR